ncbi:Signal transduction histidine-protein kinase/phosphatase DegS [Propionispora sp. 2/2-37]|uniref:sensor histidine kinase n=1 Tax=Propionispora sp. 2/2-37 TaxID=1677858 RepID=UPI0006BB7987|nr:sensor histidine kinase [Propionispora sp. 2/2-37]CUH97694.1 Signal transduction histidine-protein kinase/phosphatase DegS [Propionispora sp. 2/2-37]
MQNVDSKLLDKIIKQILEAIEQSKIQIFDIYEAAKSEMESVKKDVERVKQATVDIIFHVDDLEKQEKRARLRLMGVSRNFRVHSEDEIKRIYDETKNIQVELAVAREQEQSLKRQRDDLEIRLKSLKSTVGKAENLVSQVGVVLGYLGNQMEGVVDRLESLQQSQNFGAKIIKAQEEERLRVAREIHDGPAQAMANLVFRAEVCERLIDVDLERVKGELKSLRSQARACLQETRKIIFDLRPMMLDDLGLLPTIRGFLETLQARSGIVTELRIIGEDQRLNPYLEIGLFRVVQEAVNNVEKHAKAHKVIVLLEFRRDYILTVIDDDGQGFDTELKPVGDSFGILGMRERINLLKGRVEIKSEPKKGTRVIVKVPVK